MMRIKLLFLLNVYGLAFGSTTQEQAIVDQMLTACKSQYDYTAIVQQATALAPVIQQTLSTIVQNNFNVIGAINYLQAVTGPTTQTTPATSLYSFAAQQDTNGSYYCPSYNLASLLSSVQSFNCKGCSACSTGIIDTNSIKNLFTLSSSQCQIHCGSTTCSATNNLAYQAIPANGYIYDANTLTGVFQSVMNGQLCDAAGIGNFYIPVGCQCSGFDLSLDQINSASGYPFGSTNSSGNTSIIMECPICQYLYQATNVLILVKYQALDLIYQQLQNPTTASAIKTYCAANPTTAGCSQYATMRAPLVPQSRNLNIPWQYNINAKNQCDPNANNGMGAPENQEPANYCLLVDLNKLYQLQDVFNLLNLIAKSLQLLWQTTQAQLTTLQSEIKACVTDQEQQYALQTQISNASKQQQILDEQQELINQQGPINALKTLNQKLGLANNFLNIGMMSYQILMPKELQEAISKGYSNLLKGIKGGLLDGLRNLERDLSSTLQQLVEGGIEDALTSSAESAAAAATADLGSEAVATASTMEGALSDVAMISEAAAEASVEAGAEVTEAVSEEIETVAESVADILK